MFEAVCKFCILYIFYFLVCLCFLRMYVAYKER